MQLYHYRSKGFTLIELLVIMSIIAFLAAMSLVALSSARAKSRNAKRVTDIRQIISALALYQNQCNVYPVEPSAVTLDATLKLYLYNGNACGTSVGDATNGGIGPVATATTGTEFLPNFTPAPLPVDGCTVAENDYQYTSTNGSSYTLTFCLGAKTGDYAAGPRTVTNGTIN